MISLRSLSCGAVMLFAAVAPPSIHAGEVNTPGEKSAFYVTVSLAVPIALSVGAVGSTLSGPYFASQAIRDRSGNKRAGTVAPMRVEAVETLPDGARQVRLQDPQQADNAALLRWQARQDDPAAGFHVGQMVSFQPTPAGSGWLVHAPQGEPLAFLPTDEAAASNSSHTW
ncbi:hypothetical protein [Xanthomonas campestris]|uniref:hypothetical protein n=1 Tax=Xanthomonas campestris TaxID=339 RepID=UPI0027A65BBD|nr:hypothetical protein JH290_18545 [Xanthomonas campestris pv. incanae]